MPRPAEIDYDRQRFTYADVLDWDEDYRAEILDGALFVCSPPATYHQGISSELVYQLKRFLRGTASVPGKTTKVFAAPFGVRLFPKTDFSDNTVLEPDITVVCDPAKLDTRGCNGAPDMIIEILSPSNIRHDLIYKFNKYLKAGVREYWIVDPETRSVQAHTLEGAGDVSHYRTSLYGLSDPENPDSVDGPETVPVSVLPGCVIDLRAVFAE
jgi:Uma2 family endonuclease